LVEEVVRVTPGYRIVIPATARTRAGIKEGDLVKVVYDEAESVIKIAPLGRKRLTLRIGRRISVEEIEKIVEDRC
jgi:AbrB family looped-hinge helix DNA binding protein